ncbi:MAG: hypothetical protein PHG25_01270 [Candidatus Pacebacteria bacterium]|nr:hypothetical protein [Candidatus Paceibacterota bacterium]
MNKKLTKKAKPAGKKAVKAVKSKKVVIRVAKAPKANRARVIKKTAPTKKVATRGQRVRTIRLTRVHVAQTANSPGGEVFIAEEFIRPTAPSGENGHRTEPVHENGNVVTSPQIEVIPEPVVEAVSTESLPLIVEPKMGTSQVEVIYRNNIRFEHYIPEEKKFKYPLVIQPERSPGDWLFKEFCTKLMEHGHECYVSTVREHINNIRVHDSSGMIPDSYDEDLGKFVRSLDTPVVLIGFAGGSTTANRIAHSNKSNIAGYVSLMGNLIDWSRDRLIHPLPCRSLTLAQRNGLTPRWIHKWICSRLGFSDLILIRDNRGFIRERGRVRRLVSVLLDWLDQNASYLKPKS